MIFHDQLVLVPDIDKHKYHGEHVEDTFEEAVWVNKAVPSLFWLKHGCNTTLRCGLLIARPARYGIVLPQSPLQADPFFPTIMHRHVSPQPLLNAQRYTVL